MRGSLLSLLFFCMLCEGADALRAEELTAPAAVAAAPAAAEAPPVKTAPEFKPPFPQRQELFLPPNTKGLTKAQREEVRTEVTLKGFVNVDGLRALLTINGKPITLSAGETNNGVELVAINPPEVTLQRGRVRWNEVLYSGNPGTSAKPK